MPKHHITREERVKIEAWKDAGETNGDIAKYLGRHRSNIGRELKRNIPSGKQKYKGITADHERLERRTKTNQQLRKLIPESMLAKTIEAGIRKYWSPEQIVGRMKLEHPKEPSVCHETVYQYIYAQKPELKKFLRCRKGKYRRRYGTRIREKRRGEAKKKRIDTRPAIIEKRSRIGDWEGDTIVGAEKTKHILTHVERKSGLLAADKVDRVTAEHVRKITTKRFKKIPKRKRHTITYDNGVTFEEHETLERDLDVDVYFAYPYHSWERGTNENANGLLRQFIPKGSTFQNITQQKIDRYVKLINTRPRKRHGYRTPQEIYTGVAI
jgi:IS30 family transposase